MENRSALKRQMAKENAVFKEWDCRDNDITRLPSTEAVHLGGLVLTEVYTPSTVSMLYRALDRLPMNHNRKREWLTALTNSRRGGWGGWQDLGVVRRPGDFIVGEGYCDPRLPDGVEAVWLYLHYIAPSLAIIVATFTLTEEAGDLSALLREDYQTRLLDISPSIGVRIKEKLRRARPGGFKPFRQVSRVEDQKCQVCDTLIRRHEQACGQWLTDAFRGWFSTSAANSRPIMRLVFTQEQYLLRIEKPYGCDRLVYIKVSMFGDRPSRPVGCLALASHCAGTESILLLWRSVARTRSMDQLPQKTQSRTGI